MFHSAQIVIFHSLYNYSVLLSTDGNVSFFVQLQCSTQYSWWCFILCTVTMFYSVQLQCFTQYRWWCFTSCCSPLWMATYDSHLRNSFNISSSRWCMERYAKQCCAYWERKKEWTTDRMRWRVDDWLNEMKSGWWTEWDEEWMTDSMRWRVDDWHCHWQDKMKSGWLTLSLTR